MSHLKKVALLSIGALSSVHAVDRTCSIDSLGIKYSDTLKTYTDALKINCKFKKFSLKTLTDSAIDQALHYDRAIIIGTSNKTYVQNAQKFLVEKFVNAAKNECRESKDDIRLQDCINKMICDGEMLTNLKKEILPYCD